MDAGPLARVDPDSLARFPIARSFEGIVADHLGNLVGVDAILSGAKVDVVAHPPEALDGVFASTVDAAADTVANDDATIPPSTIPELLGAGDNADARRIEAEKYLPGADAPIEQDFKEPPAPPEDLNVPGGVEHPEPQPI